MPGIGGCFTLEKSERGGKEEPSNRKWNEECRHARRERHIGFTMSGKPDEGHQGDGENVTENENGFIHVRKESTTLHSTPVGPIVGFSRQRLETLTPCFILLPEQTPHSATRGTTALRGWSACPEAALPDGQYPCQSRRWAACHTSWRAGNPRP